MPNNGVSVIWSAITRTPAPNTPPLPGPRVFWQSKRMRTPQIRATKSYPLYLPFKIEGEFITLLDTITLCFEVGCWRPFDILFGQFRYSGELL